MENLSMENPAFVALVHCAGTLGLNMLIKVSGSDPLDLLSGSMISLAKILFILFQAPLTGFMRYKQGSFANPEDALVAAKGDADEAKKLMG